MALCPAKRPKPRALCAVLLCAVLLCAESVAVGAGATITLPWTQNRSPTAGKTDDRSSLYLCSLRIPLSSEVGRSLRFRPQLSGTRTKAHTLFLSCLWPGGGPGGDHGLPGPGARPHLVWESRAQPTKLHLLWVGGVGGGKARGPPRSPGSTLGVRQAPRSLLFNFPGNAV